LALLILLCGNFGALAFNVRLFFAQKVGELVHLPEGAGGLANAVARTGRPDSLTVRRFGCADLLCFCDVAALLGKRCLFFGKQAVEL